MILSGTTGGDGSAGGATSSLLTATAPATMPPAATSTASWAEGNTIAMTATKQTAMAKRIRTFGLILSLMIWDDRASSAGIINTCLYLCAGRGRAITWCMEWQIIVTLCAAAATFLGLSIQVRHSRRIQHQEIKTELQAMVTSLQDRIERNEERHDKDMRTAHSRISELRRNVEARMQKIDQIEGEIKAQGNLLRTISDHLITRQER